MATIINISGNDFVVFASAPPPVLSTLQIRSDAATRHSVVLPQAPEIVNFTQQIRSERYERLFTVNIGGAIRPPKKPTSGFIYPRRLA
jgi:hypothetical protein